MYLIYSTQVSLFFSTIPVHIDASVPSWHEADCPDAVDVGLMHSVYSSDGQLQRNG